MGYLKLLFLLHQVVHIVAFFLEPFALGLAFCAAQGVGVVSVGNRENCEVASSGDSNLAWIDGRRQVRKDQGCGSCGNHCAGRAFDLSALSIDGDVINAVSNFFFWVFCWVCETSGVCGHGEAQEAEHREENALEHGLEVLTFSLPVPRPVPKFPNLGSCVLS